MCGTYILLDSYMCGAWMSMYLETSSGEDITADKLAIFASNQAHNLLSQYEYFYNDITMLMCQYIYIANQFQEIIRQ